MLPAMQPIAAIQGASGAAIQDLLHRFTRRWARSYRLVGVVERRADAEASARNSGRLESVSTGDTFPLFQDLGPGSTGCCLDTAGPARACEVVTREIARGCDLVVLNKFGKLEAENRSGLLSAFVSAVENNVPILTAVSPKYEAAWSSFASPLYAMLPAEEAAIEKWWAAIRSGSPAISAG